LTNNKL